MPTRPPGTPDVDLTFDGATGTINGGVFMTGLYQLVPDQFSSFLEIRHTDTEQGYNTDGALQQDQIDSQNQTHSILLAEVPIVIGDGSQGTVEGVVYREFRLNLGEAGSDKQYLSLDAFQIWQQEAGNLTNFTPGSGFAGAHTNYLAYDLDLGADRWIGLKEGLNGNGAVQTEFTILIPDSFFINDPAHRYVTLYSKFGLQDGWDTDSSSEQWGLSHASGGPVSAMTVHKTATVPGGTANVVGEVISYDITVANVGNTNLTGITVTDPLVTNLAAVDANFDTFNDGDTNQDNQLSTGETWQYTGSYTVTQFDIDNLGTSGDGTISNTVTADAVETAPVSATAIINVEQTRSIEVTKTADVSSVDQAGNVISYTVNVTNVGTGTLTGLTVTDPQFSIVTPILGGEVLSPDPLVGPLLVGDYNIGDTNENGIEDPGETFQFTIVGDDNQNGIQDPGEVFTFVNVGDTNANGIGDPGEVFQFYNAGDTNENGIEDMGETFQFNVSHVIANVDANDDGQNDGDANLNGQFDIGETWSFAVSYTLTQDDIDNGGMVDPGLTHDNTATVTTSEGVDGSASAAVDIEQNPHLTLTKSAAVVGGVVDAAGDVIHYRINVTNDGNMTLTNPVVSDPSVSLLAAVESGGFNDGDTDQDGKLDLGETWKYTASHAVTQDEIDNGGVVNPALTYTNTASVTTAQGTQLTNADPDANDTGSASVPIVQNPHVTLLKSASVADGTANAAGDVINYTINVTNDGNMTLTNPVVSDPSVSNLAYASGDNGNGVLDLGETWHYTANRTVTQADIDNGGVVNPALTYTNTASVTTAQGTQLTNADPDANDSDSESVSIVQDPRVTLTKSAAIVGGVADAAGDVIHYRINVTNIGNMTLTNPVVGDPSVADLLPVLSGGFNDGDADQDGKLDLGETWKYTASHTVTQAEMDAGGTITNTASVTTDQGTAAPSPDPDANDSDTASITIVQSPSIVLDKEATVPGDTADTAGEVIDYTIDVTNNGNVTLTGVDVDDGFVDNLAYSSGDDGNGFLDVGETWQFTASHTVTQAELNNNGGGDGVIENTASVSTDQGASASDSESVTVVAATGTFSMTLEKVGIGYYDLNNNNVADTGDTLVYQFTVHNTGTGTLTEIQVNDTDGNVEVTGGILAALAGGDDSSIWMGEYEINGLDVADGEHINTAVANSNEANASSGNVHTSLAGLTELMV